MASLDLRARPRPGHDDDATTELPHEDACGDDRRDGAADPIPVRRAWRVGG